MRRFLLAAGLVGGLFLGGTSSGWANEKQAVAAIEKAGGEAVRVGLDASKPVFWADFSKNRKMSDADLKRVAPLLKDLPDLRRITLSSPKITDKGLVHLKDLKQVEDLSLEFTGVTDAGLKQLKDMRHLTAINLTMTKVSDRGVADLKKALPKAEVFHRIGKGG